MPNISEAFAQALFESSLPEETKEDILKYLPKLKTAHLQKWYDLLLEEGEIMEETIREMTTEIQKIREKYS